MSERAIERIEIAIDAVAAASFAGASGFCAVVLLRPLGIAQAGLAGAAALVVSFLLCHRLLRKVAARPPVLALAAFEAVPADEPDLLLLTDADRLNADGDEPLELDDVLVDIDPDSRVVRLFDPSAMPTPGQLKARIDRHLDEGAGASGDASQALFEALAELRRSLA